MERKNKRKQRGKSAVSWQNKDITAKVLADSFKGKSLEAFGLHLPRIVDTRPTNLPDIEANELRLDELLVLEDGSWAIIDYESCYSEANKVKYLGYVARVTKRMYDENKMFYPIRVIVLYTADVRRGTTKPILDLGAMSLTIEEAFLSDLDGDEIRERIDRKLKCGETLDDIDLMQLAIFPLTYAGEEPKQRAVREALDLAEQVDDEQKLIFALTVLGVFAYKVIADEDRERINRRIAMTELGRKFWEDAMNEGHKEGRKAGRMTEQKRIARRMLQAGHEASDVSDCTGLTVEEVQKLQKGLPQPA